MTLRPLGILVTGDPVAPTRARVGGFSSLVKSGVGAAWSGGFEEIDARTAETLPSPHRYAGLIVTGSASSVASAKSCSNS